MTSQNRRPTMKDNQAKYPQLRFKGFTDPWEQRKSSAIFHTITDFVANGSFASLRENVSYSDKLDYAIVVRLTDYSNGYKGPFLYTSKSGYDFLKKSSLNPNDILISNVGANAGLVFKAPILDVPMTLGPNSILVRTSDQDREFMYQLMRSTTGEHLIKTQIGISAQPKFNKTEFKQIIFTIPKSQEEQQKIGNLFHELDHTIALHQRKLAKLKELKQGYLQKLFPENGSKFPQLRFAGFADDWEDRKLRDLLNKNSEKNKNLSVINVESVSNKTGFTKQTDQFEDYSVASADLSNYYVIREKQFAYNPSRINVGSIAYKDLGDEISVVSPLYVSFSTKKVLNDGFLWNWFKTASFDAQRQRLSEGGVRDTLSFNQLSEMNTMFPTYPEQEKIASFFKQLDNTIALHQRKLDFLKEQKKGLLQKMFV